MVLWLVMWSIVSSCDHEKMDLQEGLINNLILIISICLCTMGCLSLELTNVTLSFRRRMLSSERAASDLAKKFHLAAGKFRWMNPK